MVDRTKRWFATFLAFIIMFGTISPSLGLANEETSNVDGVVVSVEDHNGEPMADGDLELYEHYYYYWNNNSQMDWKYEELGWDTSDSIYSSERTFRTKVVDGLAYIPNAYLLEGRNYEIFVSDLQYIGEEQATMYHKDFTADNLKEINLTKDLLTEVTMDFDLNNSEFDNTHVSFKNSDNNLGVYPVYTDSNYIESFEHHNSFYASTTGELLFGTTEIVHGDTESSTYSFKNTFALEGSELFIELDYDQLVEVTSDAEEFRLDWYWNSGTHYVTPGHSYNFSGNITDEELTVTVDNSIFIDEETHINVGTDFTGEVTNEYFYNDEVRFNMDFTDDYNNRLAYSNENYQWNQLDENTFTTFTKERQQKQVTLNPLTREITNVELIEELDYHEPLIYQIYQEDNLIAEEKGGFSHHKLNVELDSGDYTLKADDRNFTGVTVELEEYDFSIGEGSEGDTAELVTPEGYKILENSRVNAALYNLNDDNTIKSSRSTSLNNIEWLLENMDNDSSSLVVFHGQLEDPDGVVTAFAYEQLLTREELANIGTVEIDGEVIGAEDTVLINSTISFGYQPYDSWTREIGTAEAVMTNNRDHIVASLVATDGSTAYHLTGELQENQFVFDTSLEDTKSVTFEKGGKELAVQSIGLRGSFSHDISGDFQTNSLTELVTDAVDGSISIKRIEHGVLDTPWLHEWRQTGWLGELSEDVTLSLSEETYDDYTIDVNDYNQSAEIYLRIESGDFELERVQVYQEPDPTSFSGVDGMQATYDEQSEVTTFADFEYEGTFTELRDVPATVTIKDRESDEVVFKQDDNYISWWDLEGFDYGNYELQFELPVGPREKIEFTDNFTYSEEGEDGVKEYIFFTTPEDGMFTNESNVTLLGETSEGAELTVTAENEAGDVVDENTIVSAGQFAEELTLTEDGEYTLTAKISDEIYDTKTITLDTVDPETPELDVTQQGNSLELSWQGATDAEHFTILGGKTGELEEIEANYIDNYFQYLEVEVDETYEFQIVAYDKAGNSSESSVESFSTADFAISSLNVETEISTWDQLEIGSALTIQVDGSYLSGYKAFAGVTYKEGGEDQTAKVLLDDINETENGTAQYSGSFDIVENIEEITSVSAYIENTDEEITEEVSYNVDTTVGATISGSVGNGDENVELRLRGPRTVRTDLDENGQFELKGLRPGAYNIDVIYASSTKSSVDSVDVIAGEVKSGFEVNYAVPTLEDITINFTGQNIDQIDSINLDNWNLFDEYGYDYAYFYDNDIDVTDNQIVIENRVQSDNYWLNISGEGFAEVSEYIDLSTETTINVELVESLSIEGKVIDENGQSLVGAEISVRSTDESQHFSRWASSENGGNFHIDGIRNDTEIKVEVRFPGFETKSITLDPREELTELESIQLQTSPYIEGTVLASDYQLADNVWLSLHNENGNYIDSSRTNSHGEFRFGNLQGFAGPFEITTYVNGVNYSLEDINKRDDVEFVLREPGEGAFANDNTSLIASEIVKPGEEIAYTLNYNNESSDSLTDVIVELNASNVSRFATETEGVTIEGTTITINGISANESGVIEFTGVVAEEAKRSITTSAEFQVGEKTSVVDTSTSVLLVTLETPSSTQNDTITVRGTATAGADIEIFDGDTKLKTIENVNRQWDSQVTLDEADLTEGSTHELTAKLTYKEQTVESALVTVNADGEFASVTDANYNVWNGEDINIELEDGISRHAIREFSPINVNIAFDGEVEEASIKFLGEEKELDKDGNTFTGQVTDRTWTSSGNQIFELVYVVDGHEITVPLMKVTVLIDPAGFLFEGTMDNRLENVTAIVEEKDNESGLWSEWDSSAVNQDNPQVTGDDGRFRWDVPEGLWRVQFDKDGYEPLTSRNVPVPPPETELNLPMTRLVNPQLDSVNVSNAEEDIATDNEITIRFDQYMELSSVKDNLSLVEFNEEGQTTGEALALNFTYETSPGVKVESAGEVTDIYGASHEITYYQPDESIELITEITFTADLSEDTVYQLSVLNDMQDYDGKTLEEGRTITFTTEKSQTDSNPGTGAVTPTPVPEVTPEREVTRETNEAGQTIVTVKLGENAFDQVSENGVVSVSVENQADEIGKVEVTAEALASLENKHDQAHISVKSAQGDINFPIAELGNREGNVVFSITPSEDDAGVVSGNGLNTISPIIDFKVEVVNGENSVTISNFTQHLKRSINVNEELDSDRTSVVRLNDDGSFTAVPTFIDGNQATFVSFTNSKYVVVENKAKFKDVADEHWASDYINKLGSKFIINGMPDGSFAPKESTTRAEFAALIARSLGLDLTQDYDGQFADVEGDEWYVPELVAAVNSGIIEGHASGNFAPGDEVSREQAAVMVARSLELVGFDKSLLDSSIELSEFEDGTSISTWAQEGVELIAQAKIMEGRSSGMFDANGAILRQEIAATLERSLRFMQLMN